MGLTFHFVLGTQPVRMFLFSGKKLMQFTWLKKINQNFITHSDNYKMTQKEKVRNQKIIQKQNNMNNLVLMIIVK